MLKTCEHRCACWLIAEGHIVETMSWLPLLRPAPATGGNVCPMASFSPAVGGIGMKATDPKTTTGAQVKISETRKNNCRAASSASESGQVKVDIGGDMLAIATTKTQHEHLVPQNPSDTNVLPDIIGGKRKTRGRSGGQWWTCPKARSTNCRATATVAKDLIQLWVGGWRQRLANHWWQIAGLWQHTGVAGHWRQA